MKIIVSLIVVFSVLSTFADGLPIISTHPQTQTVAPGNNATLTVVASGATGYQWRFNGTNIAWGSTATLTITNAQTTDSGYYMVLVKNATGWVPSQMAYLSVVGSSGMVPFSNLGNPGAQARYQFGYSPSFDISPITNGTAQVVAGPALDQMQPIGTSISVSNGYFKSPAPPFPFGSAGVVNVPTVAPGRTVYYRVDVTYPNPYGAGSYTQPSRILKLVAGSTTVSAPSSTNLVFPIYIEWPTPNGGGVTSPPNQIRVCSETVILNVQFFCYFDYGIPTLQWRKDGKEISGATNFVADPPYTGVFYKGTLTITNFQAEDVGVYDAMVFGDNSSVSHKMYLSIQTTNGKGCFASPRINGQSFLSDFLGVAGRNYLIEWSTNLSTWNDLVTLSNSTGTVTFTNMMTSPGIQVYRSKLLSYP